MSENIMEDDQNLTLDTKNIFGDTTANSEVNLLLFWVEC